MSLSQLEQDALLPLDIQFNCPLSPHSDDPKAIFLTGATGFLGGHLLVELLTVTKAEIYCLIRGDSAETALNRLQKHLQAHDLWQDTFTPRIIPIVGDLAQPQFGLNNDALRTLASTIDVIYHNGGRVSFLQPYSALKPANVCGTIEILRLAAHIQTKPVHFTSSLSIFLTAAHVDGFMEADVPQFDPSLKGGYKQSKWVADRLVLNARDRGLPVAIYRPSRIVGHSQTGITGDLNDPLNIFIKGCILLGYYPATDVAIEPVPVDYVSRAMVHLSQQSETLGSAFHLYNPQPLAWQTLFEQINELGYTLKPLPFQGWMSQLKQTSKTHPEGRLLKLLGLILRSPNNNFFHKRPPLDARQTTSGLANTDVACPSMNKQQIATQFDYFFKNNFVPLPQTEPLFAHGTGQTTNSTV